MLERINQFPTSIQELMHYKHFNSKWLLRPPQKHSSRDAADNAETMLRQAVDKMQSIR